MIAANSRFLALLLDNCVYRSSFMSAARIRVEEPDRITGGDIGGT